MSNRGLSAPCFLYVTKEACKGEGVVTGTPGPLLSRYAIGGGGGGLRIKAGALQYYRHQKKYASLCPLLLRLACSGKCLSQRMNACFITITI